MNEVANRYAQALVSIAKDEQKFELYKLASLSVQEIFVNEPDILKFFKSHFVSNEEKFKIIESLTSGFNLDNFTNFMKLIVAKHKVYMFKDIVNEIVKNINRELDIFEGFIYSVEPLKNEKITEICSVISEKLNKKVELKNKIDPRLIGGVKVVVHDHVFDGSIKHKLETMKEQLKERRNG